MKAQNQVVDCQNTPASCDKMQLQGHTYGHFIVADIENNSLEHNSDALERILSDTRVDLEFALVEKRSRRSHDVTPSVFNGGYIKPRPSSVYEYLPFSSDLNTIKETDPDLDKGYMCVNSTDAASTDKDATAVDEGVFVSVEAEDSDDEDDGRTSDSDKAYLDVDLTVDSVDARKSSIEYMYVEPAVSYTPVAADDSECEGDDCDLILPTDRNRESVLHVAWRWGISFEDAVCLMQTVEDKNPNTQWPKKP
eukprot:m.278617 g.278617  ORF g.278617 m.278617 type:complete len:251 (-) comp137659_c0_seq1:137-889(-)